MRKVHVDFSNGTKDTMYGEGETDAAAADDVGTMIKRAMHGDWDGLGVEITPYIRTWYISLQWAIASCGDSQIKVTR